MIEILALLAWGTLVGLDLVAVGQLMIARPLVAGTVAGALVGDVGGGLAVGLLLELFALDVMPVGAVRYPDYGVGAVAGAAVAAGSLDLLGVGIGVAVGLLVAYLGEVGMVVVRRRNGADARRYAAELDRGAWTAMARVHARGVLRDTARALTLTGVGLLLAALVRHDPPITLRGALLLAVALVGAAIGTAAAGAVRLAGRGNKLGWFAVGLAVGSVWVVLR